MRLVPQATDRIRHPARGIAEHQAGCMLEAPVLPFKDSGAVEVSLLSCGGHTT